MTTRPAEDQMIRVDITGIASYLEFENLVTVMVVRNALGHSVLVHLGYFYLFLHPYMFFAKPSCLFTVLSGALLSSSTIGPLS